MGTPSSAALSGLFRPFCIPAATGRARRREAMWPTSPRTTLAPRVSEGAFGVVHVGATSGRRRVTTTTADAAAQRQAPASSMCGRPRMPTPHLPRRPLRQMLQSHCRCSGHFCTGQATSTCTAAREAARSATASIVRATTPQQPPPQCVVTASAGATAALAWDAVRHNRRYHVSGPHLSAPWRRR